MIETIILVGIVTIAYTIVFLTGTFSTKLSGQLFRFNDRRFWTIVGVSWIFVCLSSAVAAVDFYLRDSIVGALFLPILPLFVGGYSMMRGDSEAKNQSTTPPQRKEDCTVVNQIFFD